MNESTTYGDYEANYARVEAVGRLVNLPVHDDGGGPYIRLTDRPVGNDVIAFVPDPDDIDHTVEGWDRWRVQDDESGDVTLSTDLTIESAAFDVADWLRGQIAAITR